MFTVTMRDVNSVNPQSFADNLQQIERQRCVKTTPQLG
jgi:hypothetical protein